MIKELLKYYIKSPKFKYIFIYILLCLFIYPLENVGLSKLNSKIYPLLGKSESNNLLVYLIILFVTVYSFKIIKDYVKINVNPYITSSIRKSYFDNIINKYKKNFEYTKSGDLLNQLIIYPEIFKNIIIEIFDYIIPELLGVTISVLYLAKQDRTVIKYLLILIGIILSIILISNKMLTKLFVKHLDKRTNTINTFSESISNLFQIYITNTVDKNISKNKGTITSFISIYKKYIITENICYISFKILYLISIISIIYYTKKRFIQKDYNYEKIVLIITIFMMLSKNLVNISIATIKIISQYIGIIQKIKLILNKNIDGVIKIDINKISFNNVSFKYPKTEKNIIQNMNITVNIGDKVVLFGKSGSGKSTIFKLLMGFFSPISGKIIVNDKDINNLDLTYYRNQFAYVGQDTKLFDMSVIDNIKYNVKAKNEEVYNIISKYNINGIYEKLEKGLETSAGIDGNNLSGGQKQMVLILRALLKKPKIYIFDEPTAALDPNTKMVIYKILGDIKETMLIISHDPKIKEYIPTVYNLLDKQLVKEK
tara:strand:+ start:1881 stop:3503 length:1623 start_codon:yes stop_codon:yes gene_type:complete